MAFLIGNPGGLDMRHIGLNARASSASVTLAPGVDVVEAAQNLGGVATPAHVLAVNSVASLSSGLQFKGLGLGLDGAGHLASGTITQLVAPDFTLSFSHLKAWALTAAAATAGEADDFKLLQNALSGNDLISTLGGANVIQAGAGKDLIQELGGDAAQADQFHGGRGDDMIFSGLGNDTLDGGAGNDLLTHFDGHARISGGAGDDTIAGGWGGSRLAGGVGADSFVLSVGAQTDVIMDFTHGSDHLIFTGGPDALEDLTIVQHGKDTQIRAGDYLLTLHHVSAATLTAADFAFSAGDVISRAEAAFALGWDYA